VTDLSDDRRAPDKPAPSSAGSLLVYADGPDGPLPDPADIAELTGRAVGRVLLGWVVRTPTWLADPSVPVSTVLVGSGTRRAVACGQVTAVPARLSGLPGRLGADLRPDVAVVGAVADGTGFRFANSVGWAPAAARHAAGVVIERWPGPPAAGAPRVEGTIVGVYDRGEPPDEPPQPEVGPVERRIGRLVASLVPDRATVQWGPGTIGAAVVAALQRPVAVWSGLVTDEVVGLERRGLLAGPARAAYLWGSADLAALRQAGRLLLEPVERTHDLSALSARERLVSVNTALEVGLDGSVNVERVGGRTVSGSGGHPDFCAAASRSPGGISVVALRSSFGTRSGIVARCEVVSTPRVDVDVVVTEHGVADLRGLDDAGRSAALLAVADPVHRPGLIDAAAAAVRPVSAA
jgi:acyl-CoA hydrolase